MLSQSRLEMDWLLMGGGGSEEVYKREGQSVKPQNLRGKDLADSAISHLSDRHAATPSCRHSVHTLTPPVVSKHASHLVN